jgi:FkbM family methyltransferase
MPMLPPRMFADMLLQRPKYPGCREFVFRPRLLSPDRDLVMVDVRDRQGTFRSTLRLRRDTTDVKTFEQIFLRADYQTCNLARHADILAYYHSSPHPLILNLGANVGLSALYFAKNWPKATIVGIEPDAGNHAIFSQNVAGQKNITPIRGAIASARGHAQIVNPHESEWGYRTEIVTGSAGGLPAIPVTELLDRYRDHEPFICKIDIEGAEQELFSRNTQWVAQFPIVIIELHDWLMPRTGSSANFLRVIAHMDRDFVLHGENIFSMSHRMAPFPVNETRYAEAGFGD